MKISKTEIIPQFRTLHFIFFTLFIVINSYSQDNQAGAIQLKSGIKYGENIDLMSISEEHMYDNTVYAIMQFEKDSIVYKKLIEEMGIRLNQYIPDNAYWATIPYEIDIAGLRDLSFQGFYLPEIEDKISTTIIPINLDNPPDSIDMLDIIIETHKSVDKSILHDLSFLEIDYENEKFQHNQMTVASIHVNDMLELLNLAYVKYIDLFKEDHVLANSRAKTVGAEYVQHPDFGGLTGQGIDIALHDRNARHIDLRARVLNYNNYSESTHANMCAGMIGGMAILAGSKHRGVAPASTIHMSYNRSSAFYQDKISASTVSGVFSNFGTYNLSSVAYDQNMLDVPTFVHSVSAGNSGLVTPSGFSTVLPGWQSAKNVMSVGALNYHQDTVWIQSSRGPTKDGRIKPDIVATGFGFQSQNTNNKYIGGGGTSFSGPQVAGGVALMSEHFQQLFNGEVPTGGLIKSVLCNSATDKGNPGPDYKYGFGKMNLINAKSIIDNGQFLTETITDRDLSVIEITAPANVNELKVMINWTDAPGSTTAALSLVNDLNLIVVAPDGTHHYPLILDPSNPSKPATQTSGVRDSLNNVEQVVINTPVPGTYLVVVHAYNVNVTTGSGSSVIGSGIDKLTHIPTYGGTDTQEYSLSYQFIETGVNLIGPIKDETVKGDGPSHYIEWDYQGPPTSFTIEYTFNDGNTWLVLNDNVDEDLRIYPWSPMFLKNINTDQARVRITANGTSYSDQSSAPFKIYDTLKGLKVKEYCTDIVQLDWNPVQDAIHYKVTQYNGVDEMMTLFTTTDITALVSCDFNQADLWFAVQPVFASSGTWGNQDGVRSAAIKFNPPASSQVCGCDITNYITLRDIYLDTDGDNWLNKTGWPTASDFATNSIPPALTDMSTWYGVTLNANGCISELILGGNNLVGTIPNSIGDLGELKKLSLRQNKIGGTIPLTIGNLLTLENLWLDYNKLIGNIPTTIGNLTELKTIDLDFNQLTGGIPSSIGNLVNLHFMALDSNYLEGNIPASLGSLINLEFLYLKYNELDGDIPTTLGNLTQLIILSLHDNDLTGSIPPELGDLVNVKNFMLDDNELTGDIPSELKGLSSVVNMRLSGNNLSGTIPKELAQLGTLKVFTVHDNHLSGCYHEDLLSLCGQLNTSTNFYISDDNMFNESWEDFCDSNGTIGVCPLQTLGDTCEETTTISGTINTGVYKAQQEIIASGQINTGSHVELGADEAIVLDIGFEIDMNSVFEAIMEGCDSDQ